MARKSAAQAKPANKVREAYEEMDKKTQLDNMPTPEEVFETGKQVYINTLEASIVLAKRVDNLLNIRDYAMKFWAEEAGGKNTLSYYKELQKLSIETYEQMLKIANGFEYEEFIKDEMKDYFEDLIPQTEDVEVISQLCEAGLIFLTVKPFGEKMTQLHYNVLDAKKAREALE